jgi:hypothetical protein
MDDSTSFLLGAVKTQKKTVHGVDTVRNGIVLHHAHAVFQQHASVKEEEEEKRQLTSFVKFASISRYWMPFCMKDTNEPGGTSCPLIVLLWTRLSDPNVKAECWKPVSLCGKQGRWGIEKDSTKELWFNDRGKKQKPWFSDIPDSWR